MVITIIFLLEKKGNGKILAQFLRHYNMAWKSFTFLFNTYKILAIFFIS